MLDAVAAALSLGSDINAPNPAGDTALHTAAAQGYDTVVTLLVEKGADLNARNKRGLTPLGALLGRSSASRQSTIALLRSRGAQD